MDILVAVLDLFIRWSNELSSLRSRVVAPKGRSPMYMLQVTGLIQCRSLLKNQYDHHHHHQRLALPRNPTPRTLP